MTKNNGDHIENKILECRRKAENKILECRRKAVWQRLIYGCTVSDEEILAVDMEPRLVRRCAELEACSPTPEEWIKLHKFISGITYEQLTTPPPWLR